MGLPGSNPCGPDVNSVDGRGRWAGALLTLSLELKLKVGWRVRARLKGEG